MLFSRLTPKLLYLLLLKTRWLSFLLCFLTALLVTYAPTTRHVSIGTSVALAQSSQSRMDEAERLSEGASDKFDNSQYQAALQTWQAALAIYQEPGVRSAFPRESLEKQAGVLNEMDSIYVRRGEYQQVEALAQQRLAIFRELEDSESEIEELYYMGGFFAELNQYRRSLAYYEEASALAQRMYEEDDTVIGWFVYSFSDVAWTHERLGEFEQALEVYEQMRVIYRSANQDEQYYLDDDLDTITFDIARMHEKLKNHQRALNIYHQILDQLADQNSPYDGLYVRFDNFPEPEILNRISDVYEELGQTEQALDYQQQAYSYAEELIDISLLQDVEETANQLIREFTNLQGRYSAEELVSTLATLRGEVDRLELIIEEINSDYFLDQARLYARTVPPEQGIIYYQRLLEFSDQFMAMSRALPSLQSLPISRVQIEHPSNTPQDSAEGFNYEMTNESRILYSRLDALLRDGIGNYRREAHRAIAELYGQLQQYEQAVTYYEIVIAGYEQDITWNQDSEYEKLEQDISLFRDLGYAYYDAAQYQQAIDAYERVLALQQGVGFRAGEMRTWRDIGNAYRELPQSQEAIAAYERSLAISQDIGHPSGESAVRNEMGSVYIAGGEYQEALAHLEKSLEIRREIGDRNSASDSLHYLGLFYAHLGQYEPAIEYYQESLSIRQAFDNHSGEAVTLNNIGKTYQLAGDDEQALNYYRQSLPISREANAFSTLAYTLDNMGTFYRERQDYDAALESYEESIRVSQSISGARAIYARALSNIGLVYSAVDRSDEAVEQFQQALAIQRTIADPVGEAASLAGIGYHWQQQEQPELAIVFYKESVNVQETVRFNLSSLSRDIKESYTETVSETYRRLAELLLSQNRVMEALHVLDLLKVQELQDFFKDVNGNERTSQGLELLQEEQQFWDAANIEHLKNYIQSDSTAALMDQLQQTAPAQNLTLESYADLQTRLQNLGTNSALFYPLILDDRVELVIFTRNAPPIHRPVSISNSELEQAIRTFRADLQNPYSQNIESSAQQLYNWLFKPIESDLQKANIETLIYAPDGQMRYVPLAALYNGQQWLVEKYQINYITALSLTDIEPETLDNPQVLAGAFSESNTEITIGTEDFSFGPIPFAENEVETLASIFSNTTKLLDTAFNREAMASERMNAYNIVHFATHGKLVSGTPEDSFILLNNGEYITLREIRDWNLPNVALVVLSACQTALGDRLGNGIEIIGFGYQLQQAQARASIATLWEISDVGTNSLMDMFYGLLRQETMTPVEALRQAQIALITGNHEVLDDESRAATGIRIRFEQEDGEARRLGHPYYWAPFVLIGNGL